MAQSETKGGTKWPHVTLRRCRPPRSGPPAIRGSAGAPPIEGGEQVARYLVDIAGRAPGNVTFLEHTANGQPGLVAQQNRVTFDGVRVRRRGRPDQASPGNTQPEKLRPWTTG
jgi:RNA polymerase sigma-70 factor, ECF subfamily